MSTPPHDDGPKLPAPSGKNLNVSDVIDLAIQARDLEDIAVFRDAEPGKRSTTIAISSGDNLKSSDGGVNFVALRADIRDIAYFSSGITQAWHRY